MGWCGAHPQMLLRHVNVLGHLVIQQIALTLCSEQNNQWQESCKTRHMGSFCDQRTLCAQLWAGSFAVLGIHSMVQPGFTAGVGKNTGELGMEAHICNPTIGSLRSAGATEQE